MKTINYWNLYTYLKDDEKLPSIKSILRNIWRIRQLPTEFKNVVLEIVEGRAYKVGEFSVEGVTLRSLVQEEYMKPIQSVLFLDWFRREPNNARAFMASRRFRSEIQPLNESEIENIKKKLEEVRKKTNHKTDEWCVPEDNTKEDIIVDSKPSQDK